MNDLGMKRRSAIQTYLYITNNQLDTGDLCFFCRR